LDRHRIGVSLEPRAIGIPADARRIGFDLALPQDQPLDLAVEAGII
jgi:hypothetical protein